MVSVLPKPILRVEKVTRGGEFRGGIVRALSVSLTLVVEVQEVGAAVVAAAGVAKVAHFVLRGRVVVGNSSSLLLTLLRAFGLVVALILYPDADGTILRARDHAFVKNLDTPDVVLVSHQGVGRVAFH